MSIKLWGFVCYEYIVWTITVVWETVLHKAVRFLTRYHKYTWCCQTYANTSFGKVLKIIWTRKVTLRSGVIACESNVCSSSFCCVYCCSSNRVKEHHTLTTLWCTTSIQHNTLEVETLWVLVCCAIIQCCAFAWKCTLQNNAHTNTVISFLSQWLFFVSLVSSSVSGNFVEQKVKKTKTKNIHAKYE